MMTICQELGTCGEDKAAAFLKEQGYQILRRNQCTPYGEIDIIAQKENIIIIAEVKTRSSEYFGGPESAVNFRKQEKIRESALWWLHETGNMDKEIRFDVLGVLHRKEDEWEIKHWVGGFE